MVSEWSGEHGRGRAQQKSKESPAATGGKLRSTQLMYDGCSSQRTRMCCGPNVGLRARRTGIGQRSPPEPMTVQPMAPVLRPPSPASAHRRLARPIDPGSYAGASPSASVGVVTAPARSVDATGSSFVFSRGSTTLSRSNDARGSIDAANTGTSGAGDGAAAAGVAADADEDAEAPEAPLARGSGETDAGRIITTSTASR